LRGIVSEALSSLPGALVEEVRELNPTSRSLYDVIVISQPRSDDDSDGWRMLERFPSARVIALPGDASHAFVYEMRPRRFALRDLSPQTLRDAISGRLDDAAANG